jgi:exodeoxyribonuclease-3
MDMLDASYHPYFHDAEKKGYSGTAILSRSVPLSVSYGIGHPLDNEGRTVTCEYPDFYVVCCYTPNSQRELTRLSLRMEWDAAFRGYVSQLDQQKPVLICGDLNVAHQPIDIRNPKSNEGNAGYTNEERESFSRLLDAGFVDSFRYLHPDAVDSIPGGRSVLCTPAQYRLEDRLLVGQRSIQRTYQGKQHRYGCHGF